MKKILCAVLAVLCLSVMGCAKDDGGRKGNALPDTTNPAVTDTDNVTEILTTAPVTTENEEIAENELTLCGENYDFGESCATLLYPVFDDGEHPAFDEAMKKLAYTKLTQSGITAEDGASYEITACDVKYVSEKLVSYVVTGLITTPTAAHPAHVCYTVNADPASGRLYTSGDLIGDISLVKSALSEGKFTQSYGIEDILSEISPEYITQSWREDYGIFPNVYFTGDSFGVMAEVAFAIGGYAGFEIPLYDADGMINDTAESLLGK